MRQDYFIASLLGLALVMFLGGVVIGYFLEPCRCGKLVLTSQAAAVCSSS